MSIIYKLAYIILRLYWYVFRPTTSGVLCLIECENRYLLIKNTYGTNNWKLPGGGIKKNENHLDAVKREVYEELLIKLSVVNLIGSIISKEEYKTDTVYIFHTIVKCFFKTSYSDSGIS